MQYEIGDKVQTKKHHPCGGNVWEVVRVGADIKIKCTTCNRIVMLDRTTFVKAVRSKIDE